MTTETRYLCYSDAQPGEYPDPTYVCCGWCNNLPTTFSGYWGPCTDRVPGSGFCTRLGYPSATTAITLTRTNICSFSWGYGSGNAAIGLFFKFGYPICSQTYMESTEFKNRWGVTNATLNFDGACGLNETTGLVEFYCAGSIENGLVIVPFVINGWSY